MDVCAEYRIPHSVFLSWSKLDRDKAIWHRIRVAGTCRTCGTHPDEWDPKKGGHRAAFTAEVHLCPGCEQKQRVEKTLEDDQYKGQRGLSVVMRPNPKAKKGKGGRRRGR